MKTLTLFLLVTFSINSFASNIDTVGLLDVEIQAVDDATDEELSELEQCVTDNGETIIDNTSCINEIFGDVHN
jgi:hypothetical protein